jgi:dipeptidyl aminopeptidase/acylaminoacyl peptidase
MSPNGRAAVLLHGVADNRRGVLAQAWMLVEKGYTVLAPDSRAHGESAGEFMTFGIREVDDVWRWASWLMTQTNGERLYGYGHSMGAAILLQTIEQAGQFRAVVAECPFVTFRDVAYDRVGGLLRLGPRASRVVLFPLVEAALLHGRVRWGVDLRDASPARAIRATSVPVLLIHGDTDQNIPVAHSRTLAALNPRVVEYWEVPGADHVGVRAVAGEENYRRRLLDWYERH